MTMPYEMKLLHWFANNLTREYSLQEVMQFMATHQAFLAEVQTSKWALPYGVEIINHVLANWPAQEGRAPMTELVAGAMAIRLFMGAAEMRVKMLEQDARSLTLNDPSTTLNSDAVIGP